MPKLLWSVERFEQSCKRWTKYVLVSFGLASLRLFSRSFFTRLFLIFFLDTTWKCEFCGHKNAVDLEEGEQPTDPLSEFIISPPTRSVSSASTSMSIDDGAMIIFCIDISGSMGTTMNVAGQLDFPDAIRVKKN